MNFIIADTFTTSLARLTGEEQKAAKVTALDLQLNPASPGLQFHKLDKAKDRNFWSVRVGADIRLIVHRTTGSLLLCYVDHHDKAYQWAERRKLETHPTTGAAQFVEIKETSRHIVVPVYVSSPERPAQEKPLFAECTDTQLLDYGVPQDWIAEVRVATSDTILELADKLPAEAAEALLELATGGKPRAHAETISPLGPFEHPDAKRRFRVVANAEELQRALEYPWDRWTVFLHPEQQQTVERDYSGPAKVSGSAGTGKTVVALHRAVHLARSNPDARVLLTTFSDTLARALQAKLARLVFGEPRLAERIDVHALAAIGQRLYALQNGPAKIASSSQIRASISRAAEGVSGQKFSAHFLVSEWDQVVDAWQLTTWDAYRDVARLGRKTRLPEAQRAALWDIYSKARAELASESLMTEAQVLTELAGTLAARKVRPFDFVVVDESQDLSVPGLRLLATLGADRRNGLFFAGDLGQRIFQQPFSWKSLGVDVRGRSKNLRINYRTSHQIRTQADRLLAPEFSDVDGNNEERNDTISVFSGPPPEIREFQDAAAETDAVAAWVAARAAEGVAPHEFGVFVRSEGQFERARKAVEGAGLSVRVLDTGVDGTSGHVSISTMHLAKGLEFRAVVVMACDDEIIPLQERIEAVGDDADLKEVYDTERQLLYVACTRARDMLLVTGVAPVSEFLDDLGLNSK